MQKSSVLFLTVTCALGGAIAGTAASGGVAEARWAATAKQPEAFAPAADEGGFYANWIEGRLSLGLTCSIYSLSKGERPANRQEDFLGNINQLKISHGTRILPTLEYKTCDYLSIGFSYMQLEASTMNFNNGEGDGNVVMKGPVVTADLTYPLFDGLFVPHAGAGLVFLSGNFREDTWWGRGYASPESWETLGRPNTGTRGNHYRYIDVDDATEAFFTIGLSCVPLKHVKLDVSYRRISLDPDCRFGYDYAPVGGHKHQHSSGDFDLSGDMWLFSISYVF